MIADTVSVTLYEEIGLFRLDKPIVTEEITVPAGFYSDGFTGNKLTRIYVPQVGKGWACAWVHDYCYHYAINDKEWADKLLRSNLRKCGYSKFKSNIIYLAVKLRGKGNYK